MIDEIKEILDDIKNWIDSPLNEFDKKFGIWEFNYNQSKLLLDYITNLQEELEEQKRIEQADFKTIQNLEEENERLKELCDKYEEEHNTKFNEWVFDKRENERLAKDVDFWRIKYNEEFDEALSLTAYKSRNEKAIEYIQNHQLVFRLSNKKQIEEWFDEFYKDVSNILGGDKE